jgi:hypothetical protein
VKTVDAKKASTGDEVQAKVNQDLKADNGQVVVPKDTVHNVAISLLQSQSPPAAYRVFDV